MSRLAQTYFYRTAAGAEIDLVIKMPNAEMWAIEIKYGLAPKVSKYFHRSCEDINAARRYVVYGGEDEFSIGNNIQVISLQKLLHKLQSEIY